MCKTVIIHNLIRKRWIQVTQRHVGFNHNIYDKMKQYLCTVLYSIVSILTSHLLIITHVFISNRQTYLLLYLPTTRIYLLLSGCLTLRLPVLFLMPCLLTSMSNFTYSHIHLPERIMKRKTWHDQTFGLLSRVFRAKLSSHYSSIMHVDGGNPSPEKPQVEVSEYM
jgi:hypothetical protein